MLTSNPEQIQRHIKTHTDRSAMDEAAVSILKTFLRSNGRINTNFASNDKWPNTDGTFEFVTNPTISRQPRQNFFVQIKGTHSYQETDGCIKYSLQSLAFPAYIANNITLDPGILFLVLNPDERGNERVFWKYISANLLNEIDFSKDSATITFFPADEIKNTEESVEIFCKKLSEVLARHLFTNKLNCHSFTRKEVEYIINRCDKEISESIENLARPDEDFDSISEQILPRLDDMCKAALIMNSMRLGVAQPDLKLAWEQSLLNINTKYLSVFYKGLKYIENRVPEAGQSGRLMLKYYNFLWQIRKDLKNSHGIDVLKNLEELTPPIDELDKHYYTSVASSVEKADFSKSYHSNSRYYIQKKVPFFIGTERYYEITLQLAGIYATKYNRLTVYTKEDIPTNYSIQISYANENIDLWGVESKIKIISDWMVSISPTSLNKFAKILRLPCSLNSRYGEYQALMSFLTNTGINLLDFIDLSQNKFDSMIERIYAKSKTTLFKDILVHLKQMYSESAEYTTGKNVIRYLLQNLKEETIEGVLPNAFGKCMNGNLYLASGCYPFENSPLLSDILGGKTTEGHNFRHILNAVGYDGLEEVRPYLTLKNAVKQTGEIYFEQAAISSSDAIDKYNAQLDLWERRNGYSISVDNGFVSIDAYEKNTLFILRTLIELSHIGNSGQKELNNRFLRDNAGVIEDSLKIEAIRTAFVNSRVLLIYGAAGTGKTTLINYISNLMSGRKKLFLTKTHTAKQNLIRRIDNPGTGSEFVSIDSFNRKVNLPDYDVIFVDECSTIDNRSMATFFSKIRSDTFIVLAGDIHQIESIEFGNWFRYAKDIICVPSANVELLSTWRTDDQNLINLWDEVRNHGDLITEKLAIDGPFSEEIGPGIFDKADEDEVVLCLNYDGKFGLNNMNTYLQNANTASKAVSWQEWTYKIGDPILFNESQRFSLLYNNLKGKIVDIEKNDDMIRFTIDVAMLLTENDCRHTDMEYIESFEESTRIRFCIYSNKDDETDESIRAKCIIPFQLAYAVSIHKAQGLEYNSVKIVIPQSNSEMITHGIFYTAITRAKKKLKIYWSKQIMQDIVSGFAKEVSIHKSIEIVKKKLNLDM